MAELTDATDVVADVAETVAEEATQVAEASREVDPQRLRLLLGGLGVGLIGGALIGGLVVSKRLKTKYAKIAEEEIDEMREHFRARLVAKEEKPDLSAEAKGITEREGYAKPNTPVIEEDQDEVVAEETIEEADVVVEESPSQEAPEDGKTKIRLADDPTAFDRDDDIDPDDGWNYKTELESRTAERPYVIHIDERHELDHTETTLVYYEGDDVLSAEDDSVIADKDKVVGIDNLNKFGHGSGDKNVVYVRNDKMGIEVEVVRNNSNYAEVVHGFVQHSDDSHRMKRRGKFDDDDTDSS